MDWRYKLLRTFDRALGWGLKHVIPLTVVGLWLALFGTWWQHSTAARNRPKPALDWQCIKSTTGAAFVRHCAAQTGDGRDCMREAGRLCDAGVLP